MGQQLGPGRPVERRGYVLKKDLDEPGSGPPPIWSPYGLKPADITFRGPDRGGGDPDHVPDRLLGAMRVDELDVPRRRFGRAVAESATENP
ncbi:hypothetical protein GCM10020229_28350 [Kitasatospora albolonga]